ncbi:MAG TPA: hypothetical protein VH639_30340 [Bryobacteraceae bacterium]|jgi:hypothetical protein
MVFSKQNLIVMSSVLAAFALTFGLAAQDKQQDNKGKKEWKDRAEYDLYEAASKDGNATSRLTTLEKWKSSYPNSDFSDGRRDMILTTYQQLNQQRQVIDLSQEILKDKPSNFHALSALLSALQTLKPPSAADLDLAEKTSNYLYDNLDQVYSPANKPEGVTDAQWTDAKSKSKPYAISALKWVIDTRKDQTKDNARAQADLTKLLQKDPTQAAVAYDLAGTILAQAKEKPQDQPTALFYYARAAAYDGPNSLPAADRNNIKTYLGKVYPQYHGSAEGMDQLLAMAKTNATPPADFAIKSTVQIAQEQAAKEAEDAAKNPMITLWVKTLKENLLKPDGDTFFDMNVKDAGLPGGANGVTKFKGKIVSMTPANRPKEIDVAVEHAGVADAKLTFETALPGKMEPGEELQFEGTAKSYTKEPFMIVFAVDKDQLEGWTGKNAPARKGTGRAAAKKKQ